MTLIKSIAPKIIMLALFIMMGAASVQAQFVDRFPENFKKLTYLEGDFGDYVWGVPMEAVKELEYKKLTPLLQEVENALFYQIKYRGQKSIISYEFEDNKLVRGQINVYEQHPNAQKWFDLLLEEQIDLEKYFGEPLREEFIWTNKSRMNYPEEWRFALFEGQMEAHLAFAKEVTAVKVALAQESLFKIGMTIAYEQISSEPRKVVPPEIEPLDLPPLEGVSAAVPVQEDSTRGEMGAGDGISDILLP